MTTDDSDDDSGDDPAFDAADGPASTADDESPTERTREELRKTKERLGESADKAVKGFDDNIVDLLSWLLDTETRARIYVFLRDNPNSTSDEVADGTGLYPSTVREALAEPTTRVPSTATSERRAARATTPTNTRRSRRASWCRVSSATFSGSSTPCSTSTGGSAASPRRRHGAGPNLGRHSDDEDEKRSDEADEADDGEEDGTKSDR